MTIHKSARLTPKGSSPLGSRHPWRGDSTDCRGGLRRTAVPHLGLWYGLHGNLIARFQAR